MKAFIDLAIEEVVLGQIILEGDAFPKVINELKPEFFSDKKFRLIYETSLVLWIESGKMDARLLVAELTRIGQLEQVGGPKSILDLIHGVASALHIEQHVQVLKALYDRRKAIAELEKVTKSLKNPQKDTFQQLTEVQEQLTALTSPQAKKFKELTLTSERLKFLRNEFFTKNRIPLGYPFLDRYLGYMAGEVVIVGARAGMGKTTFMLNLVAKLVQNNHKVAFFSLEMLQEQIEWKLLPLFTGKSNWTNSDPFKLPQTKNIKLYCGRIDISALKSFIRVMTQRHEIKVFFIDYLQLISEPQGKRFFSREDYVAHISASLSAIAKELKVTLVVGCQINREALKRADNRPNLGDLRDSGAIEQDADVVLLLHRPAYYGNIYDEGVNDVSDLCEVTVAKNRMGRTGITDFTFDGELGVFSERKTDDDVKGEELFSD